jgi:hypothetical protein
MLFILSFNLKYFSQVSFRVKLNLPDRQAVIARRNEVKAGFM